MVVCPRRPPLTRHTLGPKNGLPLETSIVAKVSKEDHRRMSMEHVLFAKAELERGRKAPVHVKSEEIWVDGREPYRTALRAHTTTQLSFAEV